MCGRYSFSLTTGELKTLTGSSPDPLPEPVYNQSPGRSVLALLGESLWASPVWGVETTVGQGSRRLVINARSETAAAKPLFREAFGLRRCLLPASGFFEWKRGEGRSQPFYFQPRAGVGLLLGGLVLRTENGPRVVVLTRDADSWMSGIHHRAPVLVRPERRAPWLDPELAGEEAIRECSFPDEKGNLQRHPVSARVNRVAENDPDLTRPMDPQISAHQTLLFE